MEIRDIVFVYHLVEDERVAWHGRYHSHGAGEYETVFFLDGYGTFLCGKTRHPISPKRLFLCRPQEFHSIIPNRNAAPVSYYAILFHVDNDEDLELSVLVHEVFARNEHIKTIQDSYRFQCEEITHLWKAGGQSSLNTAAKHSFLSFLYRVYESVGSPKTPALAAKHKKGAAAAAHVAQAIAIMQQALRKNISVGEIARILALSTEHLTRIFRVETTLSPHQYFMRLKIEGASGLLISTSKRICEISDLFGFDNQFHFSRMFKNCTGFSPLQYRQIFLQTVDFRHE
jgi:AraC-like DNA-binding protein